MSGLSSLVRPTFGIYGLLAVLFSSLALLQPVAPISKKHRRPYVQIGAGLIAVMAGFFFLLYSNRARFGSPLEFGHHLTISGDMIVYATRFDNPFAGVGFIPAAKELFSWLFLSPFHTRANWCTPHAIPWQADKIRWREIYQTTFDPSWLLFLSAGFLFGFKFIWHRVAKANWAILLSNKPFQTLIIVFMLWFVIASLALSAFYLHFPTLSTRYVLDYTIAFLPMFLILIFLLSKRFPKVLTIISIVWLFGEHNLVISKMGVDKIPRQTPLSFSDRPQLDVPNGMDISEFHGSYTIDQHPIETDIPCNGCGWDLDDGLAKSVVTVMVDQPRFIEVCLADRLDGENRPADLGVYRAKIDNIELPIRWSRHETVGTNSAIRVHFSIPKKILLQNTDQLVCLCFTKSMEEADLMALRKLYEIKWR